MQVSCSVPVLKLFDNSPSFLPVHSVFRSVVNLICCGSVVSLQTAAAAVTTRSVILDTPFFSSFLEKIRASGGCDYRDQTLFAGDLSVCLADCSRLDCSLPRNDLHRETMQYWKQAAMTVYREGTLLDAVLPETGREESPTVRQLREIERYAPEDRARALTFLVGTGPGATPAGDDFLVGCLAAIYSAGARSELPALLQQEIPQTPMLSGAFLADAAEGFFSEAVRAAASANDKTSILLAAVKAAAIGHTSGCDMLGGLLWARDYLPGILLQSDAGQGEELNT